MLTGRSRLAATLLLLACLLPSPVLAADPIQGTASWYGPGNGVATPWCTWSLRHSQGCGLVRIQSLETGVVVVSPVVDWCQCYWGTAQERIVDLQFGVLSALGLTRDAGLYSVTLERLGDEAKLPDTSTLPSQKGSVK